MWVYLVAKDGSDIEIQSWNKGDLSCLEQCTHWCMDTEKWYRSGYTSFKDAKVEAIRRQHIQLKSIAYNIEQLQKLTYQSLKAEYKSIHPYTKEE